MRLIDADALKKEWTIQSPESYNTDAAEVIDSIDNAPTVAAVEVIRCEACKNGEAWEHKHGYVAITCRLLCADVGSDDFCSYGERKCADDS